MASVRAGEDKAVGQGDVDVAERFRRELKLRDITRELVDCIDLEQALSRTMRLVRDWCGCEAVSVRLHQDGDYPYFVYEGFPETFIRKENSLCSRDGEGRRIPDGDGYLLDCMCGNVIRGTVDPELPFFTSAGSFCSVHTTALLASTTEEDRQGRTRNYCNSCGYETVVLVPIRHGGQTLGLLQLNDHRVDAVDEDEVALLELVAAEIGGAVRSSMAYESACERSEHLERLVAQRTAELAAANEQLRAEMAERERAQETALRLARLDALSQMADGVSHNLNNILMSIQFPAEHLQMVAEDARLKRQGEIIATATQRAVGLVRRLRNAMQARDEDEAFEWVDVNAVAREALEELHLRMERPTSPISVVSHLGEVPAVRATELEMHDILVNLLVNAADAMPEGGTIAVQTRVEEGQLVLSVRDDGTGMDEETQRRAFEPFYTTKLDVGSGLGLATVYGTVVRWGGQVGLASTPGEGTTVTVRLPLQDESATQGERCPRLLLVEDDGLLSELLTGYLEDHYAVRAAASGQEALSLWEAEPADICLIDLGLPDMSGHAVAQAIKAEDPAVVSVLITGRVLKPADSRVAVFDLWLQKPATPTALQAVLSQAAQLRHGRQPDPVSP